MDIHQNKFPHRKRPAQMPPVERHNRPVILFVTLAIQPRGNFLASDVFQAVFLEACRDADAWLVGRYVIMPDHVHLFCVPARLPTVGIRRWSQYLKERITKRLGAQRLATGSPSSDRLEGEPVASRDADLPSASETPRGWRWQPNCWDTQVRSGEHYHEAWLYVRENPVRAGLVDDAGQWAYQGELNVLLW